MEMQRRLIPGISTLRALVAGWRARLRVRPDSEHEQATLRVIIGALFTAYLLYLGLAHDFSLSPAEAFPVAISLLFCAASILVVAHIIYRPGILVPRRVLGLLLDVATASYGLWLLGDNGIVLFAAYLWVAVGNGFRYGVPYLVLATALSMLGFILVVVASPYWHRHVQFATGLMIILVMIPLYVSTLIRGLNQAVRRANEANRAKSQFLARMSHELRTPLNGVIGMTHVLMQTRLSPEQHEIAETVNTSGRMLSDMIENVLDFSKIEAGKIELEEVDFDLHALLNGLLTVFVPQARAKGLEFRLHIASDVPFLLRGDPLHLRQILVNLIGNALKFTETGFINLTVGLARRETTPAIIRFEVQDTGIGIPVEAQSRIFESFTQADASTTRRYGGTGLGTTISKQLVELMGGELRLQSSPNEGSVFWFEIPLAAASPAAALASPSTLPDCPTLLVSGDLTHVSDVTALLSRWAVPFQLVPGAAQAFAALLHAAGSGTPYRLVLVDGSGGDAFPMQFVSAARDHANLYNLSAVLLRLDTDIHSTQEYLNAGYTSVLRIPAETRELYNVLHSVIARENDANGSVISMAGWTPRHGGAGRRRLRILVAEDNRTNQVVIESILTSANHRVDLVPDGEAALDALQKTAYDLVIADLDMPKMGGIEAMRIYGFTHHESRTPWLILTGDATRETMEECASSGADGFLTKPVKPTLLLARVTQLTESAREARVIAITRSTNEPDQADAPRAHPFAPKTDPDSRLAEFGSLASLEIERMQRALLDRNPAAFRTAARNLRDTALRFGAGAVAQLASDIEAIPDSTLPRVAGTVMHDLVRVYEESRAALAAGARPADPA